RRLEQAERLFEQWQRRIAAGDHQRRPGRPDGPDGHLLARDLRVADQSAGRKEPCLARGRPGERQRDERVPDRRQRDALPRRRDLSFPDQPRGDGRNRGLPAEQFVHRHPERLREHERDPERRIRLAGLDRRHRLPGHARHPGQLLLGEAPGLPGQPEPGPADHSPTSNGGVSSVVSSSGGAVSMAALSIAAPPGQKIGGSVAVITSGWPIEAGPGIRAVTVSSPIAASTSNITPAGRHAVTSPSSTCPRAGWLPPTIRSGWMPATVPSSAGTNAAFVPADDGTVAGIHPDRIVGGSHPALGQVLEGEVTACRPAGVMFEVEAAIGEETVTARMPGPASIGQPLVITATDPPIFWPGGAAIDRAAIDTAP